MLRRLARLCVAALLLATIGAAALRAAPKPGSTGAGSTGTGKVALVIGNGGYRSVDPLRNPANDAKLIAATLTQLGFTLVGGGPLIDLDRAHLADAVQQFGKALSGAEVGLFYYSGHGLQVQGVNWLVPVDANPTRAQDLDFQMVDADLVLRQMDGAGTRLNIVILDACRNNPFAGRGLRGLGGGLAEMRAPEGTLISYATQPGNVAVDGAGADSPYTAALATSLREPGLDIFRLFNRVGLEVKRSTGGVQQPWVSNSPIEGDFFFNGTVPTPPAPAPPAPTQAPTQATTAPAEPTQEAQLRALARTLPCASVHARINGNRIEITGQALPGPEWQDFLRSAGGTRGLVPVAATVTRLTAFECSPVQALAPYVRTAADGGPQMRLRSERQDATGRVRLVIEDAPPGTDLHVDLYAEDFTVRHFAIRPAGTGPAFVDVPSPGTPGPRLATVVAAGLPNLGERMPSERADAYVPILQQSLQLLPQLQVQAELTTFEIRKPESAPPPAPRRAETAAAPSGRCASLLEQAQLGATLSDADRAALRTGCR